MANVKVVGSTVVIESAATLDELKMIAKYRPESLTLRDEEGDAVFAIGVSDCPCGDIGKYGAAFAAPIHGENAIITLCALTLGTEGEFVDWLTDEIGPAVEHINEIESGLADVVLGIMEKRDAFKNSIQFA